MGRAGLGPPNSTVPYFTLIMQRPMIIVTDSGFEPRTSTSEVWGATTSPNFLEIQYWRRQRSWGSIPLDLSKTAGFVQINVFVSFKLKY